LIPDICRFVDTSAVSADQLARECVIPSLVTKQTVFRKQLICFGNHLAIEQVLPQMHVGVPMHLQNELVRWQPSAQPFGDPLSLSLLQDAPSIRAWPAFSAIFVSLVTRKSSHFHSLIVP
jgi:hypothetical protein